MEVFLNCPTEETLWADRKGLNPEGTVHVEGRLGLTFTNMATVLLDMSKNKYDNYLGSV